MFFRKQDYSERRNRRKLEEVGDCSPAEEDIKLFRCVPSDSWDAHNAESGSEQTSKSNASTLSPLNGIFGSKSASNKASNTTVSC